MRRAILVPAAGLITLLWMGPALAQQASEAPSSPEPKFEIVAPGPAVREATRPREAQFYREDVRVRHEPAFIADFFEVMGSLALSFPVGAEEAACRPEAPDTVTR